MTMKYEVFKEKWNDLSCEEKIMCFNDYAREYNADDEIYGFDEDFFNTFFEDNPLEAVRSCFFGNIQNWSDEYIRFNAYGNLVSMSEWEAAEWADGHTQEIYEHEEIWSSYISDDEDEEDEGDD